MGSTFSGGYFTAFRTVPGPTLYGPNRTPVTQDVLEIGLIVAFAMTWFCVLLASIGILFVNWKKCLQTIAKATFIIYFITCILVAIFGFGWRVGSLHTETTYKQFSTSVISADVGLKVGLYSFNVTLKGNPTNQSGDIVDYNERYDFGILQGRLGFGSQAGLASREFRQAQYRGTPLPILWIAEYFTLDGEQIRWGRNYRQAGYYTATLLWSAFCFFVLTILILPGALTYGANMLMLTGLTLIISCCVYAGLHQELGPAVVIPFESGTLTLNYGWSFILTLINGLVLVFAGVMVWILFLRYPDILEGILGVEIEEDDDYIESAPKPAVVQENISAYEGAAVSPLVKSDRAKRAPAIGHLDLSPGSMDASNAEAQGGLVFQSRPVYVPDRGISIRRLRKTKRKKPRALDSQAQSLSPTSPTEHGPTRTLSNSMELTSFQTASGPASPGSPISPLASVPEGRGVISVKGAVAKKAFSMSQSTSQQASFEIRFSPVAEVPSPLATSTKPPPGITVKDTEMDEV